MNEEPSPKPGNVFPEGIKTEGYQTYTYSDDFSYYAAGVPSFINGFLLQEDMKTVFPFYERYYHTNFDTKETYNEDAARFNTEFYGALAIRVDQAPALELDYTAQYDRLRAGLDAALAEAAGADYGGYAKAVEAYGGQAVKLTETVAAVNARYAELLAANASDAAQKDVYAGLVRGEIAAINKLADDMAAIVSGVSDVF
ncbi:MAG: hypothetical protein LBL26_00375 [Peptococcaceae bacterium]|nr:hypothetical protein [Peptococcaceae bacterium]